MASTASSSDDYNGHSSPRRIALAVPSSLLVLPPTAALVGMIIGISRGGSRARLRFLAENAHRQPRTVQGWYFYTKTRNYRVFFAAARTGAKYAIGLGGATAAYVLLDESVGCTREQITGAATTTSPAPASLSGVEEHDRPGRVGWRSGPVRWEDGSVAGGIMGAVVGAAYRLPKPLFVRSVLIGTIMGGVTSALQIAQAHIGRLRDEREVHSNPTAPVVEASTPERTMVDRPLHVSAAATGPPVDEATAVSLGQSTSGRAWWDPRGWVGM